MESTIGLEEEENRCYERNFEKSGERRCLKPKTSKRIMPFVTTFNPATPNLRKILIKHWHLIVGNHNLAQIFQNPQGLLIGIANL